MKRRRKRIREKATPFRKKKAIAEKKLKQLFFFFLP
jgi:hypothetical protein